MNTSRLPAWVSTDAAPSLHGAGTHKLRCGYLDARQLRKRRLPSTMSSIADGTAAPMLLGHCDRLTGLAPACNRVLLRNAPNLGGQYAVVNML